MKPLSTHIAESLLTGKYKMPSAKVKPSSREELQQLISEYIEEIKPHPGEEVNLNWIDISGVDDLSGLFRETNYIPVIDTWKIDHVKYFACMFVDNKYIKSSPIPVLQKKLLKNECYGRMFDGCSALERAPELPAKQLTVSCYYAMFRDCSALERAPELPAKKLTQCCYWSMFEGCSSLKVAPELPAMTLKYGCYYAMFRECTFLAESPALPAKELHEICYADMFKNCTSLKNKAKIAKNISVDNVYYARGMYKGCPNIK